MIYNNSFLRKELKESYSENSISVKNRISYALFLALLSFGVHFILLTLSRTVLSDLAPQYMNSSFFSVLSVYIDISYFFYIVFLVVNFQFLTFAEIRNNKWYILMKFGFSPLKMIFTKLYVRLINVIIVYGAGFVLTLFFTSFLKYPFIFEYILTLFILGLMDIVFIIIVTMTFSLYLKKSIILGYIMFISVLFLVVLKYFTGYYNIIRDRNKFNSFSVLSNFSEYFIILSLIILVCIITILIGARINSKYYYFTFYIKDLDFSDNIKIVTGSDKTSTKRRIREYEPKTKIKIVSRVINTLLAILISILVVFNFIVLFISLFTPEQEISFIKVIPYVFQSETMEPNIMYNDLSFFSKTNIYEPLKAGDIVLYRAREEVNIARIQLFQADKIVVDIDNYPPQTVTYIYREAINRNQIYGKYSGRSRWLGVLILFANTSLGRLMLLLIPSILLFYYKPITKFIWYITYENLKE